MRYRHRCRRHARRAGKKKNHSRKALRKRLLQRRERQGGLCHGPKPCCPVTHNLWTPSDDVGDIGTLPRS